MKNFTDINNRNDLADFLSIKRGQLTYILYFSDIDNYYKTFDVPKKNGGARQIKAPIGNLKYIQKRLAVALQDCQKEINENNKLFWKVSHGFEKGKKYYYKCQNS